MRSLTISMTFSILSLISWECPTMYIPAMAIQVNSTQDYLLECLVKIFDKVICLVHRGMEVVDFEKMSFISQVIELCAHGKSLMVASIPGQWKWSRIYSSRLWAYPFFHLTRRQSSKGAPLCRGLSYFPATRYPLHPYNPQDLMTQAVILSLIFGK